MVIDRKVTKKIANLQQFLKENAYRSGEFYVLRHIECKKKVVRDFFRKNLQISKKCSTFVCFFRASYEEHRQESRKITL